MKWTKQKLFQKCIFSAQLQNNLSFSLSVMKFQWHIEDGSLNFLIVHRQKYKEHCKKGVDLPLANTLDMEWVFFVKSSWLDLI